MSDAVLDLHGGAPGLAVLSIAGGFLFGPWLGGLCARDPAAYRSLALAVAGAYYLDSGVRARLGYKGQVPQPVNPGSTANPPPQRPPAYSYPGNNGPQPPPLIAPHSINRPFGRRRKSIAIPAISVPRRAQN